MATTCIVTTEENAIVSEDGNYQGYTYYADSKICMPTNSRCTKKWRAVKDIFPQLVEGRSFMDIGASFGFFCLKALEHGAKKAIGLEKHPPYHRALAEALQEVPVSGLEWKRAAWPVGGYKSDVVMMLSLVHHLYPKMSLSEIIDGLHACSDQYVIVEWINREDKQVKRKGWLGRYPEYNQGSFLELARRKFSTVQYIDIGHHPTRFIYLMEK